MFTEHDTCVPCKLLRFEKGVQPEKEWSADPAVQQIDAPGGKPTHLLNLYITTDNRLALVLHQSVLFLDEGFGLVANVDAAVVHYCCKQQYDILHS